MALVGALTPLGKVAHDWKLWGQAVSLYTGTGLLVSAALGAALGALGRWTGLPPVSGAVLAGGVLLAAVLAAREWGWVRFRLPERRLQTEKVWMHQFGARGAATLWGLHLSLTFFTRINYGGLWLLVLLAVGLADPWLGAAMLAAHWIGRALPVWTAPWLMDNPNESDELLTVWSRQGAFYRRLQALALTLAALALGVWWALAGGWAGI